MTPNQQLADFALQLVSRSTAATDDQTQDGVRAVKAWLTGIKSGEFVVGKPVEPAADDAGKTSGGKKRK